MEAKKHTLYLVKKLFLDILKMNVGVFISLYTMFFFGVFTSNFKACITFVFVASNLTYIFFYLKFYIFSHLDSTVGLSSKKKNIAWATARMILYCLLLGLCFVFVMSSICLSLVGLTIGIHLEKELDFLSFIIVGAKVIYNDFHYGNFVWLGLFLLFIFFRFNFEHLVHFYRDQLYKCWYKYFSKNYVIQLFSILLFISLVYGIVVFGLVKIFSGFNVNIIASVFLLVSIHQTSSYLNDKLKRKWNVTRILAGVIIVIYIYIGYRAHCDVKDETLSLNVRIKSYLYLRYFAPSIGRELYDKIVKVPGDSNGYFVKTLQYENLLDKKYLYGQLSFPCVYKARNHIKKIRKKVGKLSYKKFNVVDLIEKNKKNCTARIIKNYDQSTLDIDEAIRILSAHFEKFGSANSMICKQFSEKRFERKEIEKFLQSDSPFARKCGAILSRFYPNEDFSNTLYYAYQKISIHDFSSLYLSYVATTGRFIDYRKFNKLSLADWQRGNIDCPSKKKDFVSKYKKLDYTQKVSCPYIYFNGKVDYDCDMLSNYWDYIVKPELEKLTCFGTN